MDCDQYRRHPRVVYMEDGVSPESKAGWILFYLLYRAELKSPDEFVEGIEGGPEVVLWTSNGNPQRHVNFVLRNVDEATEVLKELGRHASVFPELEMRFVGGGSTG